MAKTVELLGRKLPRNKFRTVLADPPWRFHNRTGKVAPEHRRLHRYQTMSWQEIYDLWEKVQDVTVCPGHLYLWTPNTLLEQALGVMAAWGFDYVTNLIWYKVRRDGGPDGRGVGFYFRNVTEMLLFGTSGKLRTLAPGRRQVNLLPVRKDMHSYKPEQFYDLIERCSPGPYLELFARLPREGWTQVGDGLVPA